MQPRADISPGIGGAQCPTCGGPLRHRSDTHHKLFFAVITQVFHNWPEAHAFQPSSAEHLRGWLLIEAGHTKQIEIAGPQNITVAAVKACREVLGNAEALRMYRTETGIRLVAPASLKYREVGKRKFEDISHAVFEIVEAITGTPIEQFRQQARRPAA